MRAVHLLQIHEQQQYIRQGVLQKSSTKQGHVLWLPVRWKARIIRKKKKDERRGYPSYSIWSSSLQSTARDFVWPATHCALLNRQTNASGVSVCPKRSSKSRVCTGAHLDSRTTEIIKKINSTIMLELNYNASVQVGDVRSSRFVQSHWDSNAKFHTSFFFFFEIQNFTLQTQTNIGNIPFHFPSHSISIVCFQKTCQPIDVRIIQTVLAVHLRSTHFCNTTEVHIYIILLQKIICPS